MPCVNMMIVTAMAICTVGANAQAAPLRVDENGFLVRDGARYRAIGINYFGAFVDTLRDPADLSYDEGFRVLAEHEIPFARFLACGFWPNEYALYQSDKEAYFTIMDGVVTSAEAHGVGLIPSLFWTVATVPDVVGEPVGAWGDAASKTRAFMRTYTQEFVTRYKDSPAIWAWEFGNEYNLAVDLPSAGKHYPVVVPHLGTPETRSQADALTSGMVSDAVQDFAATIRQLDPSRPITSGHSLPRPAAWHLAHEGSWSIDEPTQFWERLGGEMSAQLNMASVHVYPFDTQKRFRDGSITYDDILVQTVMVARQRKCAIFVGEFGAPDDEAHGGPETARREILKQLSDIESSDVDLAALWVFDLPHQDDTHSITADNKRSGLLKVLGQANRRLKVLAEGDHARSFSNEHWSGRIYDNQGNDGREGGGFNPLWHRDYPGESLFRHEAVGLNFEHIFNGMARDKDRSMFTPRRDPNVLSVDSSGYTLSWPAEGSSWGMECRMRYDVRGARFIDMEFTATPRDDHYGLGYAALMWASYMNHTRDRSIHFYGTNNGKEGWVTFGEDTAEGFETGTVACAGVPDLPYEEGAQTLNLIEHPTKKFLLPFYYGLVDGDGDYATGDDTMVYIMMFDQREPIRFAMWNFIKGPDDKPDPHSPAWDWQYVIREPKVGQTYHYSARMVYKPFIDAEDVRKTYEAWAGSAGL